MANVRFLKFSIFKILTTLLVRDLWTKAVNNYSISKGLAPPSSDALRAAIFSRISVERNRKGLTDKNSPENWSSDFFKKDEFKNFLKARDVSLESHTVALPQLSEGKCDLLNSAMILIQISSRSLAPIS